MKNSEVLPVMIGGVRVSSNEDGLYSLNDLHKASGGEKRHSPNYWLNLESTKEVLEELQNETDTVIAVSKKGGSDQGTFVDKILLGMYASWISAKFHILVYRVFFETLEERAKALEADNKILIDFKDDIYRRESVSKLLTKDYSQFDKDVIKSIKLLISTFRHEKEVQFRDLAFSSIYGRPKVFMEAWAYMERNLVECSNNTNNRDKQMFRLKY